MTLQEHTLQTSVAHYTALAQQKGWFAHARGEVHKLDAAMLPGIRAMVAKNLDGFVVPADERGEWWKCPSQAQRESK